jgi:hypothetical protein
MKKSAAILVMVLACTLFTAAQEKGKSSETKGTEMTGVLCYATCIKQEMGKASCDSNCSGKENDVVFIDDEGKATKVANPKIAKGKMGKKVKVHGGMMQDKDMMEIYDVSALTRG